MITATELAVGALAVVVWGGIGLHWLSLMAKAGMIIQEQEASAE